MKIIKNIYKYISFSSENVMFLFTEHVSSTVGLVRCPDTCVGSSCSRHGCNDVVHSAYRWEETCEASRATSSTSVGHKVAVLEQIQDE